MTNQSSDKIVRRNWLRLAGRWVALAVSIALVWRLTPWERGPVVVPAVSPFIALASAVALRSVGLLCLAGAPVLMLALLSRRWFCRHACPLGLMQDMVGLMRRRKARGRDNFAGSSIGWHGQVPLPVSHGQGYLPMPPRNAPDPKSGSRLGHASKWARWPRVGQWLVVLTVGGACLGYPLFLWLDPLAIFAGFAGAWRWPLNLAAGLSALGVPLILLLTLFAPHLWCSRLCPLGALQEMLWVPGWASVTRRRVRPPESRGMGASPTLSVLRQPARRALLGTGLGILGAIIARRSHAAPLIRPPGSIREPDFSGVCVRCGNCVRACPHGIIRPDLGQGGVAGVLCPKLDFDTAYCHEDCRACGAVCPSGAITPLPLAVKRSRIIGLAEVDMTTCRLVEGKECNACMASCPFEAVLVRSSDDGFSSIPQVLADKCTGCGACESVCPVRPQRSIRIRPAGSAGVPARS